MENRFTFKDFMLLVMSAAVIALLIVNMFQINHHWTKLETLDSGLKDVSQQLMRLQQEVASKTYTSPVNDANGSGSHMAPATPDLQEHPAFAEAFEVRQRDDFATGDWYVDNVGSRIKKLTPLVDADYYQSVVEALVCDTLITYDEETLQPIGLLAKSWDVSEDGLSITFYMYSTAVFSDGVPLTAHDFKFTYELLRDPDLEAMQLVSTFDTVSGCHVIDDYTVEFTFSDSYFGSLASVGSLPILPEHFYSQFDIQTINNRPGILMGSGPYRLVGDPASWEPADAIKLERNPYYWGPMPSFDQVVFTQLEDAANQEAAFVNQEIDIFSVPKTRYAQLSTDQRLLNIGRLYSYQEATSGYSYIGWNQMRGGVPTVFADKRVRLAMTHLIDREAIASDILSGLASIATGPFSPETGQADITIEPWALDVDAALALLKDAGWQDRDGNGILENESGEEFVFTYTYGSGYESTEQTASFIRNSLRSVGIKMELEPLNWTTLQDRLANRNFDAITLGWSGSIESDPKQIFHTESIQGGGNYVSYSNPELDELIMRARSTIDLEARMALWHEIHEMLHQDQPYTFMFRSKDVFFMNHRFENVQPGPLGMNNILERFTPSPLQGH